MIGILGSGFGLYGYLPAVVKCNIGPVALLSKSRRKFYQRPELSFLESSIVWIEDESTFFQSIDTVFFSVPPLFQMKYIERWMHLENIKKVFLEKPIGVNPVESKLVLDSLIRYKKKINVGYVFQYTDWAKNIIRLSKQDDIEKIFIEWKFMAHHYREQLSNWKRFNEEGGSVIRFYGIQIIALLSYMGYRTVLCSSTDKIAAGDYSKWNAVFVNEGLPSVEVIVDSYSTNECFNVIGKCKDRFKNDYLISLSDPFEQNETSSLDRRVNILSELILDNTDEDSKIDSLLRINMLWQEVERINQIME